jgi:hypothetical protein
MLKRVVISIFKKNGEGQVSNQWPEELRAKIIS